MSEPRVVKCAAVMVHTQRSIHNLVLAVSVHVGHSQVVVSLSSVGRSGSVHESQAIGERHLLRLRVGVVVPFQAEVCAVPVPCCQCGSRVIASAEHGRWPFAVEEGQCRQVAIRPVGMVVAPAVAWSPVGHIVHGFHRRTRQSVKHRQVFGSAHHTSVSRRSHLLVSPVGLWVANGAPCSVDGSVGCFHHHLGPPIAVEVVGQELGEMCAGSDVSPKVNAPQACAVETVTIDEYGRREARL